MPRNKKRWIDPKKAVTFQLVHRSSRDINAGEAGEFVLKPQEDIDRNNNSSEEQSDEIEEIEDEEIAQKEKEIVVDDEGEIFGGDGYDYSQHLRPLGTAGGLFIPAPEFPEDMNQFKQKKEKKKRLPKDFPQEVLPNEIDPSQLGKDVDLSFLDQLTEEQKRRYFYQMLPGGIDLEVLDALEHPEDYEDNGELDDDFVTKANAVMLSDKDLSDEDADGMIEDEIEDEIEDDITDTVTRVTPKHPREPHTSAEPTLLDEMFEATLAKYDKDMDLDSDEEDIDAQGTVEIGAYEQVLDDFLADRKRPAHELLVPAPESKIRVAMSTKQYLEDDEDSLEGAEERMAEMYLKEAPKPQFDCESIISTYSNLENHPVLISDEPTNRIKLSKKGIPIGVLRKRVAEEEEEEEPKQNLGVAREKEESKESKKQRKQMVKQERRERREDKKIMKEAYKAEEMKQKQHFATNKVQNKTVIKL